MAKIIDGKAIAEELQLKLGEQGKQLAKETSVVPCLAVILVGERKDSQTYVRMKKQAAEKIGFKFILKEVPATISQADLHRIVEELNSNQEVHGMIVQLPLPEHINEREILDSISPEKDIDGLHPLNIGTLAQKGRDPLFVPCTPQGCIKLIETVTSLDGKNVVVLGRSNIVGMPVSLLCLHKNATVTVCHSRTKDLPSVVKQGDVVIAAVGKPALVKKDWIKEGAVVIDVGTNAVTDTTKKAGYRLVGDVDFDEVKQVASAITPVPGGVGPMTVTMLLSNTLDSARRFATKSIKQ